MLDGAVEQAYRNAGLDFRPRYHPIFEFLRANDRATVSEIIGAVGLTQPAVTQTLNHMRSADWVTCVVGEDQRERRYFLTAKAREQLPKLITIWDAVAKAANEFDSLLPSPLGPVIDAAIHQLSLQSFDQLIQEQQR